MRVANFSSTWIDFVSDWVTGRGGQSQIVARKTLSDHAPVILALDVVTLSLANHSYHIPNSIYAWKEVSKSILDLRSQSWDNLEDLARHVARIQSPTRFA